MEYRPHVFTEQGFYLLMTVPIREGDRSNKTPAPVSIPLFWFGLQNIQFVNQFQRVARLEDHLILDL